MSYDDIILDLQNQLQELENIKTQISETQTDVRNTISLVMMLKMEAQADE